MGGLVSGLECYLQKSLGDVTKHFRWSFNSLLGRDATATETLEMLIKHKISIKYPKNEWSRGKTCKKPSWMMHFPQQCGLDEMNIAKTSKIICILLPTTFLLISHLLPLTGSCSLGRDLVSKAGNSKRSWNDNSQKKKPTESPGGILEVKDGANPTCSKHPFS